MERYKNLRAEIISAERNIIPLIDLTKNSDYKKRLQAIRCQKKAPEAEILFNQESLSHTEALKVCN